MTLLSALSCYRVVSGSKHSPSEAETYAPPDAENDMRQRLMGMAGGAKRRPRLDVKRADVLTSGREKRELSGRLRGVRAKTGDARRRAHVQGEAPRRPWRVPSLYSRGSHRDSSLSAISGADARAMILGPRILFAIQSQTSRGRSRVSFDPLLVLVRGHAQTRLPLMITRAQYLCIWTRHKVFFATHCCVLRLPHLAPYSPADSWRGGHQL
jgi:hypothetical protein